MYSKPIKAIFGQECFFGKTKATRLKSEHIAMEASNFSQPYDQSKAYDVYHRCLTRF